MDKIPLESITLDTKIKYLGDTRLYSSNGLTMYPGKIYSFRDGLGVLPTHYSEHFPNLPCFNSDCGVEYELVRQKPLIVIK